MGKENPVMLSPQEIRNIESVLSKGDRVEIVPRKDDIVINRITRKQVKKVPA